MNPLRTTTRAVRAVAFETVGTNLDALSKTNPLGQIKSECSREPKTCPAPEHTNVNLHPPRKTSQRYTNQHGENEFCL